jgi:hypothetical protein
MFEIFYKKEHESDLHLCATIAVNIGLNNVTLVTLEEMKSHDQFQYAMTRH